MKRWLYNYYSTAIRPAVRLRYDHSTTYVTIADLLQLLVCVGGRLLHNSLNK